MLHGRGPRRPRTCLPAPARPRACAPPCRRARSPAPARRRLSMPSAVRSSVAAKPQQPCASTRMPMPCDSALRDVPGLAVLGGDFALARSRWRARRRRSTPRRATASRRAVQSCRGLSSRRDQPAELVLLAGRGARKARGVGLRVLQARPGVVDDDAVRRASGSRERSSFCAARPRRPRLPAPRRCLRRWPVGRRPRASPRR